MNQFNYHVHRLLTASTYPSASTYGILLSIGSAYSIYVSLGSPYSFLLIFCYGLAGTEERSALAAAGEGAGR